ncbi:RNA polymerase sigma-54 factor [Antarcticimicrobium luteum]|uniref:RNA polymerase sigma-54 factor n=1 Tax=Antarcticimicrobium luteum TaxID=2547397 RepID=A0A4R5VFK1_9RHOB|nr:RNA polymerase sigma-54 factor [Antarcticimicrobium luteum]TDK51378.1 RNA polymerase sigma-54 factor [Antarcticimicrobium luteum]
MKLGPTLVLRQRTQLKLGQELQRAIGFMAMDNLELARCLEEAAAENPWLSLRLPPVLDRGAPDAVAAAEGVSLIAHVLAHMPGLVPATADRRIALALAEELDDSGFLCRPLPEIAQRCGVPSARVEAVLAQLQRIEPRGLFARSLSECLSLQLPDVEAREDRMRRLLDALPALARGGPAALARDSGLPEGEVAALLARLRRLDPRPAGAFVCAPARVRVADLLFRPARNGWCAELNPETTPSARLADPGSAAVPRGSALSRARGEARSLIAALERRNASLLALGRVLAREQAGFLSEGAIAQRPLTRRAVARELGLHESTVGRMVDVGAAATPSGTLPLRRFFCHEVRRGGDGGASAPALMARIAEIVADEPPGAPLTDGQIAARLTAEGLAVSRRVTASLRTRAGLGNRAARRRKAPGSRS